MKVLISNDDGYGSEGIVILENVVKKITDDYYIVAPDGHRSAAGHSISIRNPLYLKKYDERHFSVSGTPADCVVMACSKVIKDKKPDVVLSGINNDKNYGNDVTTSGTFAVAIEGLFQGVKKSIALSQYFKGKEKSFEISKKYAYDVITKLINIELDKNVLLNVNFPDCKLDEVKGVKIAKQANFKQPRTIFGPILNPFGAEYYWQEDPLIKDDYDKDSDIHLLRDNYITITPCYINFTHSESMNILREIKW